MSEERKRILTMVSEGKISVEDAENLLAAIGPSAAQVVPSAESRLDANPKHESIKMELNRDELNTLISDAKPRKKPQFLRIMADNQGVNRVDIRVPLAVFQAGLNIVKFIPDHAVQQVNTALEQRGLNIDLRSIDAKSLGDLIEQLADMSIDAEGQGNKVKIFCE